MRSYIRKIVVVVLALLFCVAAVVGAGVIFSVRNVNVEYKFYSSRADGDLAQTKSALEGLKGRGMFSVAEEDISACVQGSLVLESCEFVYPSTINVTLRERLERYAVASASGGYDILDSDGAFVRRSEDALNSADNSPNVILDVVSADLPAAIEACDAFLSSFGSLRSMVERVSALSDEVLGTSQLVFSLYGGMEIVIEDRAVLTGKKIAAAAEIYKGLSDNFRVRGWIYAVGSGDSPSGVYAVYNPSV